MRLSTAVLLLALAAFGCTRVPGANDDLRNSVSKAVMLLEAGRDREFLEEFMIPYQRQRNFGSLSDEEKVKRFRKLAAERLLKRLKAAEKLEPKVNESRTDATFPLDPQMRWMRVDGIWRIAD